MGDAALQLIAPRVEVIVEAKELKTQHRQGRVADHHSEKNVLMDVLGHPDVANEAQQHQARHQHHRGVKRRLEPEVRLLQRWYEAQHPPHHRQRGKDPAVGHQPGPRFS